MASAKPVNFAGRVNLKELAFLLKLSRAVVAVDTGPMHIAAAVGTPVVALFGPTSPLRTGPYGKGHVIVRKGLDCSPCFSKDCIDAVCMIDLTLEEVFEALAGLLGRDGDRGGSGVKYA